MIPGVFYGCWVGVGFLCVHVLVGHFKYGHVPEPAKLASSFLTGLALLSVPYGVWPVISDPELVVVTLTPQLYTSIWLGLIATIGVSIVALQGSWKAMQDRHAEITAEALANEQKEEENSAAKAQACGTATTPPKNAIPAAQPHRRRKKKQPGSR